MLRELRHKGIDMERVEELEADLPEMARHCSDMERRADEAERELVQWKKVRFMADKVGDEFEGYITGVAAFGLFVQLVEHYVEGLVHVSSMADDYYRFLEKSHSLRGENTQKVYQLGGRVEVQVVRVDMERRQIDLGLVEILDSCQGRRAAARASPQQGKAETRAAQPREAPKQRPGRGERGNAVRINEERRTNPRRAHAGIPFRFVLPLRSVFWTIALFHPVFEAANRLADARGELRQAVRAEDEHDDEEDDEQFRQTNPTHCWLLAVCLETDVKSTVRGTN